MENIFKCTEERLPWTCIIKYPHNHSDNDAQVIVCNCGEQHCLSIYKGCLPNTHKDPNHPHFNSIHCDNCHGDCRCFDA